MHLGQKRKAEAAIIQLYEAAQDLPDKPLEELDGIVSEIRDLFGYSVAICDRCLAGFLPEDMHVYQHDGREYFYCDDCWDERLRSSE